MPSVARWYPGCQRLLLQVDSAYALQMRGARVRAGRSTPARSPKIFRMVWCGSYSRMGLSSHRRHADHTTRGITHEMQIATPLELDESGVVARIHAMITRVTASLAPLTA